jgi:hypothetical protein
MQERANTQCSTAAGFYSLPRVALDTFSSVKSASVASTTQNRPMSGYGNAGRRCDAHGRALISLIPSLCVQSPCCSSSQHCRIFRSSIFTCLQQGQRQLPQRSASTPVRPSIRTMQHDRLCRCQRFSSVRPCISTLRHNRLCRCQHFSSVRLQQGQRKLPQRSASTPVRPSIRTTQHNRLCRCQRFSSDCLLDLRGRIPTTQHRTSCSPLSPRCSICVTNMTWTTFRRPRSGR